jgi:hypothetical protein
MSQPKAEIQRHVETVDGEIVLHTIITLASDMQAGEKVHIRNTVYQTDEAARHAGEHFERTYPSTKLVAVDSETINGITYHYPVFR